MILDPIQDVQILNLCFVALSSLFIHLYIFQTGWKVQIIFMTFVSLPVCLFVSRIMQIMLFESS